MTTTMFTTTTTDSHSAQTNEGRRENRQKRDVRTRWKDDMGSHTATRDSEVTT